MGIRYSALPGHAEELSQAMNEALTAKWAQLRGLQVVSVAMNPITLSEEDAAMIKQAQQTAIMRDPTMAAATLVGAQAEAMKSAAKNENGAMMGFMGATMAQQAGGVNAQNLFALGAQQQTEKKPEAEPSDAWPCSCGATASGNFCTECGAKRPAANGNKTWQCSCGAQAQGNFCTECGAKRPEEGWSCACGAVNQGKFCSECGAKKPAGAPLYRCDKCGWEPEDPHHPPKFCPECGDNFDEKDKQ